MAAKMDGIWSIYLFSFIFVRSNEGTIAVRSVFGCLKIHDTKTTTKINENQKKQQNIRCREDEKMKDMDARDNCADENSVKRSPVARRRHRTSATDFANDLTWFLLRASVPDSSVSSYLVNSIWFISHQLQLLMWIGAWNSWKIWFRIFELTKNTGK